MGTIVGISDLDPLNWPGSKWRNLQVNSAILKLHSVNHFHLLGYRFVRFQEIILHPGFRSSWVPFIHHLFYIRRLSGMRQDVVISRAGLVHGKLKLLKASSFFLL